MTEPCVNAYLSGGAGFDLAMDGATPVADGYVWTLQSIEGWFDSPGMRVAQFEVQPLGEVVTLARENARALALTVVAHAVDGQTPLGEALCFAAMDYADPVFNCVYLEKSLNVQDPLQSLFADVRRVGSVQKRVLGAGVAVQFLVPLLCRDPYVYDFDGNPFD